MSKNKDTESLNESLESKRDLWDRICEINDKWAGHERPCTHHIEDILTLLQSELSKQRESIRKQLPERDTHSHMTRNYCSDCAKRDGFNKCIDQINKILDGGKS